MDPQKRERMEDGGSKTGISTGTIENTVEGFWPCYVAPGISSEQQWSPGTTERQVDGEETHEAVAG